MDPLDDGIGEGKGTERLTFSDVFAMGQAGNDHAHLAGLHAASGSLANDAALPT